jgi:hypothetical protein
VRSVDINCKWIAALCDSLRGYESEISTLVRASRLLIPRDECVANGAHCRRNPRGKKEGAGRGGNHLKGGMLAVPSVRGISSEHFWIDGQRLRAATRRHAERPCVPECCLSLLVFFASVLDNLLLTDGSPNERDVSIKCVQSAVSESETTRAARSRERTASTQCGGAHARDSSIARGTRPSAVRNPTEIDAMGLRVMDGDLISTIGPAVEDARLVDAALFSPAHVWPEMGVRSGCAAP